MWGSAHKNQLPRSVANKKLLLRLLRPLWLLRLLLLVRQLLRLLRLLQLLRLMRLLLQLLLRLHNLKLLRQRLPAFLSEFIAHPALVVVAGSARAPPAAGARASTDVAPPRGRRPLNERVQVQRLAERQLLPSLLVVRTDGEGGQEEDEYNGREGG